MDIFNALAEPRRRDILEMLSREGQLSATAISKKFNISAPAISQHLKVLKEANLVIMEKKAQQRLYKLNPEKLFELESWTKKMTKAWEERFDRLDQLLEVEKKKLNNS